MCVVCAVCSSGGLARVPGNGARPRLGHQGKDAFLPNPRAIILTTAEQITIVEPGAYATKHGDNGVKVPPHPAYDPAKLVVRQIFTQHDLSFGGDLRKAVAKIYALAGLEDPPMRLPLGKDAVKGIRDQIASVAAEVDKYESWSDDLDVDREKPAQLF